MRISDWSSDVCSSDLINNPDVFDEIAVFQGASYFRSLGRGNLYGISARGLSIGTGGPQEEFPLFRTFWLEKPKPGAEAVQVHALLDSQRVTGAYHLTTHPGYRQSVLEGQSGSVCVNPGGCPSLKKKKK